MSHHDAVPIVVGVDVGRPDEGLSRRGHPRRDIFDTCVTLDAGEVVVWCRRLDASTVGIDAPCHWSRTGCARPCERVLAGPRVSMPLPRLAGRQGSGIDFITGCATGLNCIVSLRHTIGCSRGNTPLPTHSVSRPFLMPWPARWRGRFCSPNRDAPTVQGYFARQNSLWLSHHHRHGRCGGLWLRGSLPLSLHIQDPTATPRKASSSCRPP